MIRFEPEKLRDPVFRERIESKWEEIRAVQEKHTYIAYATHRQLFSELQALCQENLEQYERNYSQPLARLKKLKNQVHQVQGHLHRSHYASLLTLLLEGQELLEAKNYATNARALEKIDLLDTSLKTYTTSFDQWQDQLAQYREDLKKVMTEVWAETYAGFKAHYQKLKGTVEGDRPPTMALVPEKEAWEQAKLEKKEDIQSLLDKVGNAKKLKKKIETLADSYASRAEFEQLEKEIRQGKVRKKVLQVVGLGLLVALIAVGVLWGPQGYRQWQDRQAWEQTAALNTYVAYDQYLKEHPEGAFRAEAEKAILGLEYAEIPNMTGTTGEVFHYQGDLLFGKPHGKGKAFFEVGSVYEGQWNQGEISGQGNMSFEDGSRYEGDWKEGLYEGRGTLWNANGQRYVGQWKAGKRHGVGSLDKADSSSYRGAWMDDRFHGEGIYVYADGSRYEGQWKLGQRSGTGEYQDADGSSYTGKWVMGRRQGIGRQQWPDGKIYDGHWDQDRRHGNGTLYWPQGGVLVGFWHEDYLKGPGSFTSRFRETFEGIWEETDQEVVLKDENGQIIRRGQLQEGLYISQYEQ